MIGFHREIPYLAMCICGFFYTKLAILKSKPFASNNENIPAPEKLPSIACNEKDQATEKLPPVAFDPPISGFLNSNTPSTELF